MDSEKRLVSVFLSSLDGAGAERAMITFAGEVAKKGYRVDLVVVKNGGRLKDLTHPEVSVVDLCCSRVAKALPKLITYIRRSRPDALYSTVMHANVVATVAATVAAVGTRVIVRESGSPLSAPKDTIGQRVTLRLAPLIYPFASGVIAVSSGVADELRDLSLRISNKTQVIPTPVISDELLQQADEPIDEPWLTHRDAPVIVSAGRLERYKGFVTLMRAIKLLCKKREARLLVLGEGSYEPTIRREIAQLDLEKHVKLVGFRPNPFPYMKHADAFALASESEGLPNVLIQAMAFGTPIVSTNCRSGPAEILCNGKYGRLVPVGNEHELAQALHDALLEPRQLEAQQYARATYSTKRATDEYLAFAGLKY
jgi:glycosyltransferase involved in cell wall biosynthesis